MHDPEQAERFAVWVVAAGELVEQSVQAVGKLAPHLRCELVPTLTASLGVSEAIRSGIPIWPEAAEKERIIAGAAEASVRAAIAAGVKIAMGTDAPVYPHGKNLRELELLVRAGMKPAQALHAATLSAARLMGLDGELGTLEPGKLADLVIADGDALDIHDLGSRIRAVYQDGVLVSARELSALGAG